MKLSLKIMGLVFLGILILLAIDGYLSVQREIKLFEDDMRHDALMLGHAMQPLVSEAWQHGGREHAMELIENVNQGENQIKIRVVWLDAALDDSLAPRVPTARLQSVIKGREISLSQSAQNGPGHFYTYIPLKVENGVPSALELEESLATLSAYIQTTILWSVVLTGLLVLVGGLLVWVLGIRFVGRPLKALVAKTQRIGAGDLSADLVLNGHDELSDLAIAMNQMCGHLSEAREAVRRETEARIGALEQLRHSERLATIGQLSAGMAHELGTPLNVIAGRAKFIAFEDLKKVEIIENAQIIREQVDRMARIMRQLLDFARRRAAKRSPSDLRYLIRQVFDMLEATARKQRVRLELVENGEIPIIAIDQTQMQQVLTNLVMNGIQAMPNGGRLELALSADHMAVAALDGRDEYLLAIRIRDEGIGISKENQKRIFEPFFTTKEVGKGTGLGLSIAHDIVTEHGGRIEVASEPGKGACFAIYLPMEMDQ